VAYLYSITRAWPERVPRSRARAHVVWPLSKREGQFVAVNCGAIPETLLEAELALAPAGPISIEHLPAALRPFGSGSTSTGGKRTKSGLASQEENGREKLIELLIQHQGNVSAVARTLGKARVQVRRWLVRHQINPDRYRNAQDSPAK
jgi:transcriptional regulator with PAS, ATPase and Fis domain